MDEEIKAQIGNISPEPIGIFVLPDKKHLRYKELIQNIFNKAPIEYRRIHKHEPFAEHICNKKEQNAFVDFPELIELQKDIEDISLKYIKFIGYMCEELIINSAWINNSKKGAKLEYHYHTNSYISGNYFVNFDKNKHSRLNFRNDRHHQIAPRIQAMQLEPTEKQTMYNDPFVGIDSTEGQIILWRSHMSHGYHQINQADDRLTFSFNAMPRNLSNGAYSFVVS
tara:strand:+ start:9295 stop:9969 length:675 start_codon:yes stop_codon:yes gene_type:complete